jgi:hypothetical protein
MDRLEFYKRSLERDTQFVERLHDALENAENNTVSRTNQLSYLIESAERRITRWRSLIIECRECWEGIL